MKKIKKIILTLSVMSVLLTAFSSCQSDSQENLNETIYAETSDTEKEISDAETESAEPEPELTWYYDVLRETTPEAFPSDTGEYSEEIKNTYLTLPSKQVIVNEGIRYDIEFHDETVFMHEYILVRMTITNLYDYSVSLQADWYNAGYFLRDDGEIALCKHSTGEYSEAGDYFGILPGGSVTHELMFYISQNFFFAYHTYTYVKSADPNFFQDPPKHFEIPISINVLT